MCIEAVSGCMLPISHLNGECSGKRLCLRTYGISLENALKAAPNVRVLVSMVAPRPSMATAPRGRGCVIIPTIVAKKMARRCQAWGVTPVHYCVIKHSFCCSPPLKPHPDRSSTSQAMPRAGYLPVMEQTKSQLQ